MSQSRNLELLLLPHQSLNGRQGTPHLAYAVLGFKPKLCATDGHPKATLQSISAQHLQTSSLSRDTNPSLSICEAAHLYVQFSRTLFCSLSFPFASYYFILSANFTILGFIKTVSNSLPPAVLCLIVSNKVLTLLGFSCCGVASHQRRPQRHGVKTIKRLHWPLGYYIECSESQESHESFLRVSF